MSERKSLSLPVVLLIGVLLAGTSLLAFFAVRKIAGKFSPTVANAERYLRKGKIEEAFALTGKLKTGSAAKELLRGKLYFARSIQSRKVDGWRVYGTDSADWLQGSDIDSALACFNAAVAVDRFLAEGWYFKGVLYKEKGWFSDAEDALQEALRLGPGSIDARLALGTLYTQTDRTGQATAILREAYDMDPENPLAAKNLAYIYRFHTDIPESATVWLNRYLNCASEGDIDINRAKTEFNDLLSRYPEYRPAEPQRWRETGRKFVSRK